MKIYNNFNELYNESNNSGRDLSVFNTLTIHTKPIQIESYYDDYSGDWQRVDTMSVEKGENDKRGITTELFMGFLDLKKGRFVIKGINIFPDGVITVGDMTNITGIYQDKCERFVDKCYDNCYDELYGGYNDIDLDEREILSDGIEDHIEEYELRHKAELEKEFSELVDMRAFGMSFCPGDGGFSNINIDTEDEGIYDWIDGYTYL